MESYVPIKGDIVWLGDNIKPNKPIYSPYRTPYTVIDIIQNKNTLEYYIVIDIINDNFITISISNFDMNDKKYYSFLTNKYDVIQDMYYYKYIMSVDIPEEPVYDILYNSINIGWGV